MAYPRFHRARAFKFARRTAGNVTISSTTNVAVDSALDLTLDAQVGDTIEAIVSLATQNEAGAIYFDVSTRVSSADVNFFSSGSGTTAVGGVGGWYGPPSLEHVMGGSVFYVLQAGDISASLVTLRLLAKVFNNTRVIRADTNYPMQFAVKNLGPVDPN